MGSMFIEKAVAVRGLLLPVGGVAPVKFARALLAFHPPVAVEAGRLGPAAFERLALFLAQARPGVVVRVFVSAARQKEKDKGGWLGWRGDCKSGACCGVQHTAWLRKGHRHSAKVNDCRQPLKSYVRNEEFVSNLSPRPAHDMCVRVCVCVRACSCCVPTS